MEGIDVVKAIVGYLYLLFWSVSFYGQVYENFKLKSVKGLSFDYQIFNFTGFLTYAIYNIWGYFDPAINMKIGINDVLFSVHAFILTCVTIFQMYGLYIDKNDPIQRVSSYGWFITALIWWGVFNVFLIEQVLQLYDYEESTKKNAFNLAIYMSFVKVFVSFIKYLPQLIYNFKRQSTKGWSIFNIILDFLGGFFSFVEVGIDYFFSGKGPVDGDGNSTLNFAKFALSVVAMFFDILFLTQHYILYPGREPLQLEEEKSVNYAKVDDSKGEKFV